MELTARSAPDGYTRVMCTGGDVAINPGLLKEMPLNVERHLRGSTRRAMHRRVATHGASPLRRYDYCRRQAQPDTLNVGTPGYGSINQLDP